jgi:hypothetical protein
LPEGIEIKNLATTILGIYAANISISWWAKICLIYVSHSNLENNFHEYKFQSHHIICRKVRQLILFALIFGNSWV